MQKIFYQSHLKKKHKQMSSSMNFVHESGLFKDLMMEKHHDQPSVLMFNQLILHSFFGLKLKTTDGRDSTLLLVKIVNNVLQLHFSIDSSIDSFYYWSIDSRYLNLANWVTPGVVSGLEQLTIENMPLMRYSDQCFEYINRNPSPEFPCVSTSPDKYPKQLSQHPEIYSVLRSMTIPQQSMAPEQVVAFYNDDIVLNHITCPYCSGIYHPELMMYAISKSVENQSCATCLYDNCPFVFPLKWIVGLLKNHPEKKIEEPFPEEQMLLNTIIENVDQPYLTTQDNQENLLQVYINHLAEKLGIDHTTRTNLLGHHAQYLVDLEQFKSIEDDLAEIKSRPVDEILSDGRLVGNVEYYTNSIIQAIDYVPCACCGNLNNLDNVTAMNVYAFTNTQKPTKTRKRYHIIRCVFCGFQFCPVTNLIICEKKYQYENMIRDGHSNRIWTEKRSLSMNQFLSDTNTNQVDIVQKYKRHKMIIELPDLIKRKLNIDLDQIQHFEFDDDGIKQLIEELKLNV
jgi:hypothetical protein